MAIIYMHNSKTSGKSYIGYTYKTIEARWEEHCHSTNKHHFQHAIAKYGKDDWTHTILEEGDHITPNKQEVYWIAFYDTYRNGYNQTIGGEGVSGRVLSDETKKKIGDANRGAKNGMFGKPNSEEAKRKISEKLSGSNHPNYGKKASKELRERMSKAHLGNKHSEETLVKMSNSRKGEKHHFYGKKRSATDRDNMSKGMSKYFYLVEGIMYERTKDVMEVYSCSSITARRRCDSKNFPEWSRYLKQKQEVT